MRKTSYSAVESGSGIECKDVVWVSWAVVMTAIAFTAFGIAIKVDNESSAITTNNIVQAETYPLHQTRVQFSDLVGIPAGGIPRVGQVFGISTDDTNTYITATVTDEYATIYPNVDSDGNNVTASYKLVVIPQTSSFQMVLT